MKKGVAVSSSFPLLCVLSRLLTTHRRDQHNPRLLLPCAIMAEQSSAALRQDKDESSTNQEEQETHSLLDKDDERNGAAAENGDDEDDSHEGSAIISLAAEDDRGPREDYVSNIDKGKVETFEIEQGEGEEPSVLQQISQDVDDLDEEAQGLLAAVDGPSKATIKATTGCCGPAQRFGNCTVFVPASVYARTGWGIRGPHWFGPPCVACVILAASYYFCRHAYKYIGPVTLGICLLWTALTIYLLINVAYRDPGIVKQGQETPTRQHRWCEICKEYQPPKGAHCGDCNVCIAGFDHHCVWMGCCIGKKNFKQFSLFNISWLLYLAYCIIWVATLGPLIFRKHHH